MNSTMASRTYPTVLRVEDLCFLDGGELLSRAVDPLEFDAVLDGGGAPEEDDGVCVGVGVDVGVEPVGVEEGEVEGVVLALNGFPSFL